VETIAWTVIGLLLLLGFRRIVLIVASLLPPRETPAGELPSVTVLVAARNEMTRIGVLLESLERLNYPTALVSAVLIDDASADGTGALLETWAAGRRGVMFLGLDRQVGKAEALNRGLTGAPAGEIVAVYDAEHAPASDSLQRLAAASADPTVGAVAGYLEPRNPDATLVSRYAALETWVNQLVNNAGKDRLGWNPPTTGGNCLYRHSALTQAGGFPKGSLSEDIEISLAIAARGWKTRFVASACAGSTLPDRVEEFWEQRVRWTCGLYASRKRGAGFESWLVALGYVDRLAVSAAVVLAVLRELSPVWPLAYFACPLAAIITALHKAGRLSRAPEHLLAAMLIFPLDLAATVWATGLSLLRRRPNWRAARLGGDHE
jgi:cellulose synthase/poly-beta-1,6-N-acetylglucosamine synthase-like glycosyltransferase